MKPLRSGPRHAILTALTTPRDLLQAKHTGRLSCTPCQSWHCRGDHTDGPAQDKECNSPVDWSCEWFLIVLRAEGNPFLPMPGLIMMGARPCDQFGHSVPQGMASCPVVLPVATGSISMMMLSSFSMATWSFVQRDGQCVPRMSWAEWAM